MFRHRFTPFYTDLHVSNTWVKIGLWRGENFRDLIFQLNRAYEPPEFAKRRIQIHPANFLPVVDVEPDSDSRLTR